jgi:hypothetical protein
MNIRRLILILSLVLGTLVTAPLALASMGFAPVLEGRWQQQCTNGNLRIEVFQQQRVSLNEIFFSDKDCRQPSVVFINDGTFVLPGPGLMDFKFTSVRLRLLTPAAVANFNARKVCGLSDWQVTVEKEISGRSCEIFMIGFPQRIPTAGDMRYGIYQLYNDRLYLGKLSKEHNANTPAARPIEMDPRFYIKVPHRSGNQFKP